MGWLLLSHARRAAMAQGVETLTDDMPGGKECDRCGNRDLTAWNPLFSEWLCVTCRNIATDRELERTRGTAPIQLRSVPPAVAIVTDELPDRTVIHG